MVDVTKDANLITVHGRESLNFPYKRFKKSATGREEQVDISDSTIYFECPAAGLRVQLVADPGDAKGLLVRVPRTDVEKIPTSEVPFAVVDETVAAYPDVEWEGKIKRIGYVGTPTP